MKLENEFSMGMEPDAAHALLLDLERVTPCLPGAEITERKDDRHYSADMAMRIGPIKMSYRGAIVVVEVNDAQRSAILRAEAKDTRGRGSARADMRMTVTPDSGGSRVHVVTDLDLTGRVAQMGRGVVQDVANDLMGQFVRNLSLVDGPSLSASPVDPGHASATPAPAPAGTPQPRPARLVVASAAPTSTAPVAAKSSARASAAATRAVGGAVPARPAVTQPAMAPASRPPSALAMFWRILRRRLAALWRRDGASR